MSKSIKISLSDGSFFVCSAIFSVFSHVINKLNPLMKTKYLVSITYKGLTGSRENVQVICDDEAEATALKRSIEAQYDAGSNNE